MKRILKWLAIVVGSLLLFLLIASAVIYVASERVLNQTYDRPLEAISIASDSATIAEGKRLATMRGCLNGCHGPQGDGQQWLDIPGIASIVAPNLPHAFAQYKDAEMARFIRTGLKADGTSTLTMPSGMFYHLSDQDVGTIIAYFRSISLSEGPEASISLGIPPRAFLLKGDFLPQVLATDTMGDRIVVSDTNAPHTFGQYLALTNCTECHGADLTGET